MFDTINRRKMGILLICLIIATMVLCLTACNSSSQGHAEEYSNGESEATDDVSSTSQESNVVLDIPEDFLDFQNYIGEDISVFGMEEGLEEYDGGTSSLYGHKGNVIIGVGWDGRTIMRAVLTFDDKEKFLEDYDYISGELEKIFGEGTLYDNDRIIDFSGKTDFDINLARSGSSAISWNYENREIFFDKNPNAGEESSDKIQNKQVPPAIGMTAAQVRASTWGEPSDINRTTTQYGVSEQWVYNTYSGTKYIYLDDGIVTAIQE